MHIFQETTNSYIYGAGKDWLAIPREWEFNQPERFDQEMQELKDIEKRSHQNTIS